MSDAVLITLIICGTIVVLFVLIVVIGLMTKDKDPDNKHGSGSHGLD